MKVRVIRLLLGSMFLVCLILSVTYAQTKPQADMNIVNIGVISPQSGPAAFIGVGMLKGTEIAVQNINDKGTTGKGPGGILVGNQRYKLKIVGYDDGADPSKSVVGMRKLVEMYKVPVIVGPFGTPPTWACQEVNVQLGVFFDGLSQSDQSRKKGNPLYMQERVPTLYFGEPMAQACIDRGLKKACILTDINESYSAQGKKFKETFERLGGQILAFETVDTKSTTDYHSIMTNFKAKKPDVIFVSMFEQGLPANHALDVGYTGKFLFSSDFDKRTEKVIGLDRIGGSLVQALASTYWQRYPKEDKRGNYTSYIKQCTQINKEDFCFTGAIAYDQVFVFARAMEIAKSVTDARAIRGAAPKALQEGKMPLIYPYNDMLKNGLMYGQHDYLLEITGDGYKFVKELVVPKEVLE